MGQQSNNDEVLSSPADSEPASFCSCSPGMDPHEAAEAQGRHHKAVSTADLLEAAHYVNFAFASYGYMLYIWSKPPVS